MKYFALIATNWEHSVKDCLGIFPESEIDEALMIAFESNPPFTAFSKQEVNYYDKAQSFRKAIDDRYPTETTQSKNL